MIRLSLSGCRFWGSCEGCILHPYQGSADFPGVLTIYYGHVIRPGDNIEPPYTLAKADWWLNHDTQWMQSWLWRHCPWAVGDPTDPESKAYRRQHNFDALCSLVGNAGHVFDDLLAEVNGENRPEVVTKLWMSHTAAGGNPKALAFRRAKEVAFYLTPDPPLFNEDEVREVMNQVAIMAGKILAGLDNVD